MYMPRGSSRVTIAQLTTDNARNKVACRLWLGSPLGDHTDLRSYIDDPRDEGGPHNVLR